MSETELERAEKRFAQAKARLQSLRNREAERQRKLDTRRKVILGGALIDLATRDDNARAMLERLIRNLARDQDRKTFEGWSLEAPQGPEAVAEAGAPADPASRNGLADVAAARRGHIPRLDPVAGER